MRADLSKLDHKNGGIPETGRVNKNREALFQFDRKELKKDEHYIGDLRSWLEEAILDLTNNNIDTIVITVKERTW